MGRRLLLSQPWSEYHRERGNLEKAKKWEKIEKKQVAKGEVSKGMKKKYEKSWKANKKAGKKQTISKEIVTTAGKPPKIPLKRATMIPIKPGLPIIPGDIDYRGSLIIRQPPGTPASVTAEHMTEYIEGAGKRYKKKRESIRHIEKLEREVKSLPKGKYEFTYDNRKVTKSVLLSKLRAEKRSLKKADVLTLTREPSISKKAEALYGSYTPFQRGVASMVTAVPSEKGWEFWMSATGIQKGKTPEHVVKEHMTEIGRTKKKDLGWKVGTSMAGSPLAVIGTSPLIGYGATIGLGKLGASKGISVAGHKIIGGYKLAKITRAGMLGAGLSFGAMESYAGVTEIKKGQTAKGSGRFLRMGVGVAGIYAGSKAGQRVLLGRSVAKAESFVSKYQKSETSGKVFYGKPKARFSKDLITARHIVHTKAHYDPRTDTIKILEHGKIGGKPFFRATTKTLDSYLKPTPAEKMGLDSHRITQVGFIGKKGQVFSPRMVSKEIHVGQHFIEMPKMSPTILPSFLPSTSRGKQSFLSDQKLDFKTITKGTVGMKAKPLVTGKSSTKLSQREKSLFATSTLFGSSTGSMTKAKTSTVTGTVFETSTISGIKTSGRFQPFKAVVTPALPSFNLDRKFGKGSRGRDPFKASGMKKGYTPSLIGIASGRRIKKPPKFATGFGVRLPLTKKSKKKKRKRRDVPW